MVLSDFSPMFDVDGGSVVPRGASRFYPGGRPAFEIWSPLLLPGTARETDRVGRILRDRPSRTDSARGHLDLRETYTGGTCQTRCLSFISGESLKISPLLIAGRS